MTAAHWIIKNFDYEYENQTYQINVERNKFYPTQESMFKIFLGIHNKTTLPEENTEPAILVSVEEIIIVCLKRLFLILL